MQQTPTKKKNTGSKTAVDGPGGEDNPTREQERKDKVDNGKDEDGQAKGDKRAKGGKGMGEESDKKQN